MSVSTPPLDLTGHCSTVHNNVLYLYSPAGFQSIPLQQNATWSTLSPGVSVAGATCVKAEPADSAAAAFYIIGGTPNATMASYPGLQRYWFKTAKWETITPQVPVTMNRQNHGAAYLKASNQLLVYAGSQVSGNSGMSSQTFSISTLPPYQVLSYSSTAPPLTAPMIMPFNDTDALLIGGSTNNKLLYTFSSTRGWSNLGASLPQPIVNPNSVKCALVTGDDGSKVLEEYDLGKSPNEVNRYVLITADGKPAPPGLSVGAPRSRKRKRDLTLAQWPAYNSSLAPTVVRSDYALAETSDGLVVISGGNAQEPIALFNQRQNSWINASTFLGRADQVPLVASSTTASSSTAPTSSSNSTQSASAPSSSITAVSDNTNQNATSDSGSNHTATVLGGTLGTVLGLGALLAIALALLRCLKRRARKHNKSYINEKDNRLSFQDQGAEFMQEAGGSFGRPNPDSSTRSSFSSAKMFSPMNIMKKSGHRRAQPSDASSLGLVLHAKSPLGMADPMEMKYVENMSPTFGPGNKGVGPAPRSRGRDCLATAPQTPIKGEGVHRGSFGSNYFASDKLPNKSAWGLIGRRKSNAGTNRSSAVSGSDYGVADSRIYSGTSTVKPLEVNLGPKFDGQRLSQVTTGSPTVESNPPSVYEGQSAEFGTNMHGDAMRYTTDKNPFVSPLISEGFQKPGKPVASDARSIMSVNSVASNPYFNGGTNPYHQNDPTTSYFTTRSRANSAASSVGRPSFTNGPRDSNASGTTLFPRGDVPALPAMPAAVVAANKQAKPSPTGQTFDFPLPKAYIASNDTGSHKRESVASNVTLFPRGVEAHPAMPAIAKPKVVQLKGSGSNSTSPVNAAAKVGLPASVKGSKKGPTIRKMTGDEDMSWLNIGGT